MDVVTAGSVSAYKRALGAYTTGVAVVTAELAQGAAAITVNSFVSVSLEPPIVMWALANSSDRYARFAGAERWGVSILTGAQLDLGLAFAQKSGRRAEDSEIERWDDGPPLLKGALARFDCRTLDRHHVGDHFAIFGEVLAFDSHEGAPLLYHRAAFGKFEL